MSKLPFFLPAVSIIYLAAVVVPLPRPFDHDITPSLWCSNFSIVFSFAYKLVISRKPTHIGTTVDPDEAINRAADSRSRALQS